MNLVGREENRSNLTPSLIGWDGESNFGSELENPIFPLVFCSRLTPASSAGLLPLHLQQQQQDKEAPGELEMEFKAGFYRFWRNGKGKERKEGTTEPLLRSWRGT